MKKLLAALLFLSSVALVAQSTTVTATITDSDSFVWKGGTYAFTFVPRADGPYSITQYTWTGGALINPITGTLNSSGALSVSVPTSSAISPAGSQWAIQICPQAVNGCFNYTTTISGANMNLTSTLSALAKGPRFSVYSIGYGYGTVEVSPTANPGVIFWDVTVGACKQYIGSTWGSCGGSSYTLPIATNTVLGGVKPDGTTFTVNPSTGVASASSSGGFLYNNTINSDGTLSTMSFTSIPAGGSEVEISCLGAVDDSAASEHIGLIINTDTNNAHYSWSAFNQATPLPNPGPTTPSGYSLASGVLAYALATDFNGTGSTGISGVKIHIPAYANSTLGYKMVIGESGFSDTAGGGAGTQNFVTRSQWTGTGAITQLDLTDEGGGHFINGSSCTLRVYP